MTLSPQGYVQWQCSMEVTRTFPGARVSGVANGDDCNRGSIGVAAMVVGRRLAEMCCRTAVRTVAAAAVNGPTPRPVPLLSIAPMMEVTDRQESLRSSAHLPTVTAHLFLFFRRSSTCAAAMAPSTAALQRSVEMLRLPPSPFSLATAAATFYSTTAYTVRIVYSVCIAAVYAALPCCRAAMHRCRAAVLMC